MKITNIGKIRKGQDGAIFGNYLFRFDADGSCVAYNLGDLENPLGAFTLDGADRLVPHCNAVVFGSEYYAEGDEFPLLYSNIYNNYAGRVNEHCAVCCVYRLWREGGEFKTSLLQTIKIGFCESLLWRSEGVKDVRPFGNFVVDAEGKKYYAFVMRDGEKKTRYFEFNLPTLADGSEVVLTAGDVIRYFDLPYHNFIQGACFHDGKIYEVEGFNEKIRPAIRIVDVARGEQIFHADFYEAGAVHEPEMIDFCGDRCVYGDNQGNLFELTKFALCE